MDWQTIAVWLIVGAVVISIVAPVFVKKFLSSGRRPPSGRCH